MEKKKLVKQALAALILVSSAPAAAIAGAEGENVVLAAGGCGGSPQGCGGCAGYTGCNASTGSTSGTTSTNSSNTNTSRSKFYGSENEAHSMLDQEMNRNMNNRVISQGPTGGYGTPGTSGTSVGSTRTGSAGSQTTDNYDDSSYPNNSRRY